MNYYEHHLGDYIRDTVHLSMLEDAAYRRLLDAYYTREAPLPLDVSQCCRMARAASKLEREAVAAVLAEFFKLEDDGYHQPRADREIERFKDKQAKASRSARARWAASKPHSGGNAYASPDAMRTHSEGNAPRARPQTPDTRHQTPENQNQSQEQVAQAAKPSANDSPQAPRDAAKRGTRLPADWQPSETELRWAQGERPEIDATREAAAFCDYWHGVAGAKGVKADWPATWRNWIRRANAPKPRNGSPGADAFGDGLSPAAMRRLA